MLELSRHFNHRSPKTETTKQMLCRRILLGCPEHDARCAVRTKPFDSCFDERTRDAGSSARVLHNHIVNESRHLAELFPGHWLESRVHVADDATRAFSDEHDHVFLFELRPQEPSIAL